MRVFHFSVLLAIVLLCLCVAVSWAEVPKPKSAGFSFGPDGLSVTYLYDGHNYALAAGKELTRNVNMVSHAWLIFQPLNKGQFGVAGTVGYELALTKTRAVMFTPQIGVEQAITEGLDGKSPFRFIWGGTLSVKFN